MKRWSQRTLIVVFGVLAAGMLCGTPVRAAGAAGQADGAADAAAGQADGAGTETSGESGAGAQPAGMISYEQFDHIAYADRYPDLKAAFGYDKVKLYRHYTTVGAQEGRVATVSRYSLITADNFDAARYAADYPDLKAAFGDDEEALYRHFVTSGIAEGRAAYTTSDEINAKIMAYEVADEIVDASMSDQEKVKAVHDWMCRNMAYDYEGYINGTIPEESYAMTGAMLSGTAVCQGYTETFQFFMDILGIPCETITGKATNSRGLVGGHAWNQVKVDGTWYNIDVTWDDPVPDKKGIVRQYTYFLVGNRQFYKDHETQQEIHT